jgi:serine/threonine protein phosphatase Stp1
MMVLESTARTHVGCRRKLNEDAVLTGNGWIWAVADGMGGHHAGEVASAKVVEALAMVGRNDGIESVLDEAVAALDRCNSELIDMAHGEFDGRTIGTTAVGLAVAGGRYACFWVGDSRGLRVRGGQIERLTRDHSLVQDLIDAGMLAEDEAEGHPQANVITRAVGVHVRLRVDSVMGALEPGDLFLLASDGLTRVVSEEEICAELLGASLDEAADRLIALSLERGAPDNVSLVIVRAA